MIWTGWLFTAQRPRPSDPLLPILTILCIDVDYFSVD